ncbi:MAG: exo-alpha-sialidase, partial [Clostridia bacterium]|nr:exo-alpha-sialidase [Clostridia bacterium]
DIEAFKSEQPMPEDPKNQTARLVFAPIDDIDNKTFIDLQTTGDMVGDKVIDMVYDTILMQKDSDTIYVMWTARTEDNYYRFYCPFTLSTKTLGKVGVNRFKVGNVINDFSVSGIKNALAENDIPLKRMYSDIGIMQKLSSRVENGKTYYYTGTYSGDFNCIIKSDDLITWEYVAQPEFINDSKWENATYVLNDKVYYFVRQQDTNKCGFLTSFNLLNNTWETPVEIEDCQSRGDFILYKGELYLFHAPIDREHIGIVKIDTDDIVKSEVVLQARIHTSCFYPFVQYYKDKELAMSYTVARQHIRLAEFTLSKYL